MFTAPNLSSLTHGFFTRQGGVSQGYFDSLNFALTKGDNLEHVRENRKLALQRLGTPHAALATAHQIHSNRVVIVDKPWEFGKAPQYDGLVTTQPNIAIGVLAADCVPILFADVHAKVIGTAHAGWRGAQSGIIENTLATMKQLGAKDIAAATGPCIHQDSYEVGPDVFEAFTTGNAKAKQFFIPSATKGHFQFDLLGAVNQRLESSGIKDIHHLNRNTYANEDQFFSCRRSFHRDEPTFGCSLSAIVMEDS